MTELRLREARLAGDLEAIGRDRARLADRARGRRGVARGPAPGAGPRCRPATTSSTRPSPRPERLLAEANGELGALRAASRARGEEAAAIRRAEAARQAEAETAGGGWPKRRAGWRRSAVPRRSWTLGSLSSKGGPWRRGRPWRARSQPRRAPAGLAKRLVRRRPRRARRLRSAGDAAAGLTAGLAALQARAAAVDARLREDEERGIARAARRRGGRRLDDELVVDPALRAAVEAALDEHARAYLVESAAVVELQEERGVLVVQEQAGRASNAADAATRRFLGAASNTQLSQ